jgi:cytidine deaminase
MDLKMLGDAAVEARTRAYAPYSGYLVGAAALGTDGRVYQGCNVENVSYPAGLCAERVAMGCMVAGGSKRLAAIAVATEDGATPCGICLQVMSELGDPSLEVHLAAENGSCRVFMLSELLPHGFNSQEVKQSNVSER